MSFDTGEDSKEGPGISEPCVSVEWVILIVYGLLYSWVEDGTEEYVSGTWIKEGMSRSIVLYCTSIQFNSKTLFKYGDPVSLQFIFPGAIQTCDQYNNFSYIYTKQHRFIRQTQANTTYTFIQNISINTHT